MSPLDAISLNKITAQLAKFPDQPSFRRYSLSPLHDCENSHFRPSIEECEAIRADCGDFTGYNE